MKTEIHNLKINLKIFYYFILAVILVFLGYRLFFSGSYSTDLDNVDTEDFSDRFSAVLPLRAVDFFPYNDDPAARMVLNNSFDSLVGLSNDFNLTPSLAVSWGLLDDLTWQFNLYPDVLFQNGEVFTANDVISSFNLAKNDPRSKLSDLFSNVSNVEALGVDKVIFKTNSPDLLLPLKLSRLYIVKGGPDMFYGTGPYLFDSDEEGVNYRYFEDYRGKEPSIKEAEFFFEGNKNKRVKKLIDGEVDFVSSVPVEATDLLKNNDFIVSSLPSLEVQFLVFNRKGEFFNEKGHSKIFTGLFDKEVLLRRLGVNVLPADQFVSSGVFGFNPSISLDEVGLNFELLKGKSIQIHLPEGLSVLGEYLRTVLKEHDVFALISYLKPEEYYQSLEQGKADLYFMGFKSDLADASDFFNVLVRKEGSFNFFGYENTEVEKLLSVSAVVLDENLRREILQKLMKIVVDEDVFGMPLFEYETLYAFRKNVEFKPRLDGMIYLNHIRVKK